jgi:hypothetical protein
MLWPTAKTYGRRAGRGFRWAFFVGTGLAVAACLVALSMVREDGFKYAAALLWERRRDCPGDPKVVNLVHDEVVVETDAKEVEAGKAWVERCMLDGMAEVLGPDAPVSVEISVADSWGAK